MFDFLHEFSGRPAPFSRYTVKELWTQPHLSEQMLSFHLSQETELASRRSETIDSTARWIDARVPLDGKRLCDLGCGPGLYAQRFRARGAEVTGVDFSARSIAWATANSDSDIRYLQADYLADDLPIGFDIVTLIYTDFCVLSPDQRSLLLRKIRRMLGTTGHLVLDVVGMEMFNRVIEATLLERKLMDGFWSPGDYVGLQKTFRYDEEAISLDRYAIVEADRCWEIYNWFQYYTPQRITRELEQHGFQVVEMAGSLTGDPLAEESELIGIIAETR